MSYTIHRFNPFNLPTGVDHDLHMKIQEIISYAESRFWTIINEISKSDLDKQTWTQKLLQRELVWSH
jgi:hypothetical protein